MHEVLVNRLGGLSLPRKSVVRLTDRPDMNLDVYRGRKTTMQQSNISKGFRVNDWTHFAIMRTDRHKERQTTIEKNNMSPTDGRRHNES